MSDARSVPADVNVDVVAPAWQARRISWGAVFAGTLLALAAQMTLATLGVAIGLATVDPATEAQPLAGLGLGAGIWWMITGLVSLFLGGWVAARVANNPRRSDGALHGVLTWALVGLLSFYLVTTSVGRLIGGALGVVGQGISAVGTGAVDALAEAIDAQGVSLASLREDAQQFIEENVAPGAAPAAAQELGDVVEEVFTQDAAPGEISAEDRQALVDGLAEATGVSPAEAEQTVDAWIATYQEAQQALEQARQTAADVAEDAANVLSTASLWTFIALALGALVAMWGGRTGTPRDVDVVVERARVVP